MNSCSGATIRLAQNRAFGSLAIWQEQSAKALLPRWNSSAAPVRGYPSKFF